MKKVLFKIAAVLGTASLFAAQPITDYASLSEANKKIQTS